MHERVSTHWFFGEWICISLVVRPRMWLGFSLFTRRLRSVAVSRNTRCGEAVNDMMQTNDKPMPYRDINQHSRLRSSTGCAGRSSCFSSGSSSIFVSRRSSAPQRTPQNTNLDHGVRLRAGGHRQEAPGALRQPVRNPTDFEPDDVRATPRRSTTPPLRRRTHVVGCFQPVQSVRMTLGHY